MSRRSTDVTTTIIFEALAYAVVWSGIIFGLLKWLG
jgi:hypothetical protein